MRTNSEISNVKNEYAHVCGRSSKTVRKFTTFFGCDDLPDSVSVSLDWSSFMVEYLAPEPDKEKPVTWFGDSIALEALFTGTPIFKHSYKIYQDGEHVASLHSHPKNEKIMQPGTAKLEMANQVHYCSDYFPIITEVCKALNITYVKNFSRMDIAIDGVEHVHRFLNQYAVSHKGGRELARRGRYVKMLGKARFNAGMKDKKTGIFNHFKIGAGHKQIVVYNKTKELERSHKEYIRDAWTKAGIDQSKDVWRVELRMTSQALKCLNGKPVASSELLDINGKAIATDDRWQNGIELSMLADPNYLLALFRTSIKNFFEFVVVEGDSNVTRARVVDLFQFFKLKVPLLSKVKRAVVNGAYKAKMAIHMAFKNICSGIYKEIEEQDLAINFIDHTVKLYNLNRFFEKKKPDWIAAYVPIQL